MPRSHEDYLRDILRAARTIVARTQDLTEEQFFASPMLVDAVLFNLVTIGEASNHLPEDVRTRRPEVEWDVIVAMRNRIAHGYWDVNLSIVWEAVRVNIPQLLTQIEAIIADMENEDS